MCKGKSLTIVIIVLGFALPVRADKWAPPRPVELGQLGWAIPQKAFFVPGCELAFVDYERLRRDFPNLRKQSDQRIREIILENAAFVSELELKLQGIRISEVRIDRSKTRWIWHPPEHNRAAVAELEIDGRAYGLFGFKGPLLGPEAIIAKRQIALFDRVTGKTPVDRAYVEYVKELLGNIRESVNEFQKKIDHMKAQHERLEQIGKDELAQATDPKERKEVIEALRKLGRLEDTPGYRAALKSFHERSLELRYATETLRILELRYEGNEPEDLTLFLELLRARDYSNGAVIFSEAVSEVARQRAAEKEFNYVRLVHPETPRTVGTYWVLVYPFDVLQPGGKSDRVANFGRQAVWRFRSLSDLRAPKTVSDAIATLQRDEFDSLIDTERVVVDSVFVQPVLKDDHKASLAAQTAAQEFLDGEKRAVERFIRNVTRSQWGGKLTALTYLVLGGREPPALADRFQDLTFSDTELDRIFMLHLIQPKDLAFAVAMFSYALSWRPGLAKNWTLPLVNTIAERLQVNDAGDLDASVAKSEATLLWTRALMPMLKDHPSLRLEAMPIIANASAELSKESEEELFRLFQISLGMRSGSADETSEKTLEWLISKLATDNAVTRRARVSGGAVIDYSVPMPISRVENRSRLRRCLSLLRSAFGR